MSDVGQSISLFIILALSLALAFIIFIKLPADMARRRNRSPLGWVLVSLLFSPAAAILLLLLLGARDLVSSSAPQNADR